MGLFGKGKKKKGADDQAPAINPGPLRDVPRQLPNVDPDAGATFDTSGGKPILPPEAVPVQPSTPKRTATLKPAPLPEHDLVDLASADEDVTGYGDDPSKTATGQIKVALKQQGVDTPKQVMDLLGQIEGQLSQLQQLRTERKVFMADLDQRNEELQAREARIKELEDEAHENARIVDQLKAQANQDTETLQREKSALESSRQLLEAQRKTIEAHQKTLDAQRAKIDAEKMAIEETRTAFERDFELAQENEAKLAERDKELATLQARIAELEAGGTSDAAQAEEFEQRLEQTQAFIAELEKNLAEVRASIVQRDQTIEQLNAQLEEATAPGAQPGPAHTADEFLATRKARLARVRKEINDRARKLQMAHDQLRDRKRELDQKAATLSAAGGPMSGVGETQRTLKAERQQLVDYAEALKTERNKLVQLNEQVQRTARKANARAAKHRASTMLFSIVGSLAVIAAASWVAAQRFAEATYIAAVTIKADASGNGDDDALQSWTRAHEAMLDDPQFHEKAADRLRSRGLKDLSSPSAVAQFIKTEMTVEASEPGQVRLTATGVGAPRTERVLESFAAAVAAHSNSMRDYRADGLPTVVASAAKVDEVPIEDPRLQLFGMIFGGASAVLLFGGLVLWRRIAADQQAFEEKIKMSEGDFDDVLPPPMTNVMQQNK